MVSREYKRKCVKIPLRCWKHEDEGVKWLGTSRYASKPNGDIDRDRLDFRLIHEVEIWLADNGWYKAIYPGGYGFADLIFDTRVKAIGFALRWL